MKINSWLDLILLIVGAINKYIFVDTILIRRMLGIHLWLLKMERGKAAYGILMVTMLLIKTKDQRVI